MVLAPNNPAVSLETRRWLNTVTSGLQILDGASRDIVQRMIDKCSSIHPGGLVFELARWLGSDRAHALTCGSAAEVFYAACSITDDVQDGDDESFFGDLSFPLRLNGQTQLVCLAGKRVVEFSNLLGGNAAKGLQRHFFDTCCIMLTGQRQELCRDPWRLDDYLKVAKQSAGEQFGFYLHSAALIAQKDPNPWIELGRDLGVVLQIIADVESQDDRLFCFTEEEINQLCSDAAQQLKKDSKDLGDLVNLYVYDILKRCPNSLME